MEERNNLLASARARAVITVISGSTISIPPPVIAGRITSEEPPSDRRTFTTRVKSVVNDVQSVVDGVTAVKYIRIDYNGSFVTGIYNVALVHVHEECIFDRVLNAVNAGSCDIINIFVNN